MTFCNRFQRSVVTKKPVRVIRGFKGRSAFAPAEGYRYDGLYTITKAWLDVGAWSSRFDDGLGPDFPLPVAGESGFKVCRFALIRMDGQSPIPIQAGRESEAAEIIAVRRPLPSSQVAHQRCWRRNSGMVHMRSHGLTRPSRSIRPTLLRRDEAPPCARPR